MKALAVFLLLCFHLMNFGFEACQSQKNPKVELERLAEEILAIYNNYDGANWAKAIETWLSDDALLLSWNGDAASPLKGPELITAYFLDQADKFPHLKKRVGRYMLASAKVEEGLNSNDQVLVIFYEASTNSERGEWKWAGCDLITLVDDKIVDFRLQEDTQMKLVTHPKTISMDTEYDLMDRFWKKKTTSDHLMGMAYLLDVKRGVMSTEKRDELILARMEECIEQTIWGKRGIALLKGKEKVKGFSSEELGPFPDFYENIERVFISGNALIMVQHPSGTQKRKDGSTNHAVWYDCNLYFFDGPMINALLFQRDTLINLRNLRLTMHQE